MKSGIFRRVMLVLLIAGASGASERVCGQLPDETYRRSSLYSLVIAHPEFRYGEEIEQTFLTIPIPEKFNDHNLNRRVLNSPRHDRKTKNEPLVLTRFLEENAIAKRLVAKWYDREKESGAFDMELIAERGFYDADFLRIELARNHFRGYGVLADAGEELIRNTFVLVNDIYYVDKELKAQKWAFWLNVIGAITEGVTGSDAGLGQVADIVKDITGFRVIVVSHLYRLVFTEETMMQFYGAYYYDAENPDPQKKAAFDRDTELFRLEYVNSQVVDSGKTSIRGVNTESPEQMIRKVCTRAIDKSIAELQHNNEVFRVKTPLYSVSPQITAKIGMKEGVDEKHRYEVLERRQDEDGRTTYKRMGIIQPVAGKIWDNRYMALEEEAENSGLNATTFKVVRGGDFYPGMLIREIKVE